MEPDPTPMAEPPTLPSLDAGVTLLASDGRTTGALQSLVLDHLLLSDGGCLWVDADGHATTTSLADLAPSRRTLDRIRVARAFTAFQHYGLVGTLPEATGPGPSLLVAPAVDRFYAADDLHAGEGETMLDGALETLGELAAARDLPVLVTRHDPRGLGRRVAERCDETLECTRTRFGPRFSGDGFETLVYDRPGGGVQTTLAFWRRVLLRRHRHAVGAAGAAGTADGADAIHEPDGTATSEEPLGVTTGGAD